MDTPTPDEVVKMVEACSTEEIEKLLESEAGSLYGMMVKLAVQHEYNRRQNLSSKQTITGEDEK